MLTLLAGHLRHRWLEYALAAAAVSLLVAGVSAEHAVTSSAEESVHALAHQLGKNMLVLPSGLAPEAFYAQRYAGPGLDAGAPAAIRASPLAEHVMALDARLYGNATVNGVPVVVVGEDREWPRLPEPGVLPAVVGAEVARALGAGPGAPLEVAGQRFAILEVAQSTPEGLDGAIFVPLLAAQRILGRPGEINALHLGGCWCRIDVAALGLEVEKLLPGTRAITVAGMLQAQQGAVATMKRYASATHAVSAGLVVAIIMGLVASQGRRSRRELALLVAIGVPPGKLALLLASASALVGAMGGLAGSLLAVPATRLLSERVLGAAISASPALLVPAVLGSAALCGLAALLPAGHAAALDPTDVLREA